VSSVLRRSSQRLALSALALFSVMSLVFVATRMIGDPSKILLPDNASAEQRAELRAQYGLDDPMLSQFGRFLRGMVQGDFGDSLYDHEPALRVAISHLPPTLLLSFFTILAAVPAAIFLGMAASRRPGSLVDRAVTAISLVSASTVEFVVAILLILVFAVKLQLLPTSGYGGAQYLVLPVLVLALRPLGRIAQVTRNSVLEETGKPYVVALRAAGIPESRRRYRHVLRNAATPVVAIAGVELVAIINGSVIVEAIFAYPGIGNLLINSIERRDGPNILAIVFVTGILVLLVNFLIDVVYGWLDPRVVER
jgi:peptide/nickel transport system permease protein